jgi:hypothetical protein
VLEARLKPALDSNVGRWSVHRSPREGLLGERPKRQYRSNNTNHSLGAPQGAIDRCTGSLVAVWMDLLGRACELISLIIPFG